MEVKKECMEGDEEMVRKGRGGRIGRLAVKNT